jgi:hypothetical protein
MEDQRDATGPKPSNRRRKITQIVVGMLIVWGVVAYLVVPGLWTRYARRHPAFDSNPRLTQTGDHHPGDPLNVAMIGSEAQLRSIMQEAKWFPAAALGLKSDFKIAVDTVLSRPDQEAPVSSLYLFGRKEDLAFEQPVGDNPRHRHHVRFWKTDTAGQDGQTQWIGSAVYDQRVGLSRTTGQITHVTAPDVDTERNYLYGCLEKSGYLADHYAIDGFHKTLEGHNGGGDPWRTDGVLYVGVIAENIPALPEKVAGPKK